MARRMPEDGRVFVQAESEVAAINMVFGAAAAGARVLVVLLQPGDHPDGRRSPTCPARSSRGGGQHDARRPGPGQHRRRRATTSRRKGGGHGDYRGTVLAPASIGEAIELVGDAFVLAERYRTPVMILADGIMGQAMEPVRPDFPTRTARCRLGSRGRRGPSSHAPSGRSISGRRISSVTTRTCRPSSRDRRARGPLGRRAARRRRKVVIVAYGTAARVARTAVERAREQGLRAGLFRPITLWPFPAAALREAASGVRAILVVELSAGQLVEDVRLTMDGDVPVLLHGRVGGMVPSPDEVVAATRRAWSMAEPVRVRGGAGRVRRTRRTRR